MSQPRFRNACVLFSCSAALFWGASAFGQEPSCDLECLKGYTCEIQTAVCPDLPRGDTPCVPTPVQSCVAVPCSSDTDCAERMKCYDDNTSDEIPSQCAPDWLLGCNVDADCGEGFTCAPE